MVSFQVIITTPGVSIIRSLVGCDGIGRRKINTTIDGRGACGRCGGAGNREALYGVGFLDLRMVSFALGGSRSQVALSVGEREWKASLLS